MDLGGFLFVLVYAATAIIYILFIILIIYVVAKAKLYDKAGDKGWAALIPFYSYFRFSKLAVGNYIPAIVYTSLWVICLMMNITVRFMEDYPNAADILEIISDIGDVVLIGITGFVSYYFGKAYGKSKLWNILMIFFNGIMIIIMGFNKNTQYVGPKGVPQAADNIRPYTEY